MQRPGYTPASTEPDQPARESLMTSAAEGHKVRDQIVWVPVDRLRLDPENPRLPEDSDELDRSSQESIARYMDTAYEVEELGVSIAERGFQATEPLWITPSLEDEGAFTVVEGNRRLAALMFLTRSSFMNSPFAAKR